MTSTTPPAPLWKKLLSFEIIGLAVLLIYPLLPFPASYGDQLTTILIFSILALGLNVVMGSAGILHLGIAGFFGIGAYITGILMVPVFPFQTGLIVALIASTLGAAGVGILLGLPTLRLRGDYLALVTLGFGEVVRYSLRNFEEITNGTRSLNPIPPPTWFGLDFAGNYVPFFVLSLAMLVLVVLMLRNLEQTKLGRAWNAIREDELAATCMGINAKQVKLSAFAIGAALAGLAGSLYAAKLTTTAEPDAFDFNRSIIILCCVILGGMGSIRGVLLGVFLLVGYDSILTPLIDEWIQSANINPDGNRFLTFSNWRLMIFGLALIVMMRFRPEGLLPSQRIQREMHATRFSGQQVMGEDSII